MKTIIYKNPIISAMMLNLFTLFLGIYIYINNSSYFIFPVMMFTGLLNGKILNHGTDMNNKKKILIIGSLIVMSGTFVFYIYNTLINKYS
jgi:hypothetical protein